MTPAAKIAYFGALLIGLSIGAFFGFQNAAVALKDYYKLRQITAPAVLHDFSYLQYKHADPEHAKAALQTLAGFLEEMEKFNPETVQKRDLALVYTRLALLEEAANNPEQSHALMTKARYWYTASSGRDLSESEMKAASKIMDERLHR
jgi:hypothetical protein